MNGYKEGRFCISVDRESKQKREREEMGGEAIVWPFLLNFFFFFFGLLFYVLKTNTLINNSKHKTLFYKSVFFPCA